MNLLQVEDHQDLVKDTDSGAVLSIDRIALEEHRQSRERSNQLNNLPAQVEELREQVNRIEDMFQTILQRLGDR